MNEKKRSSGAASNDPSATRQYEGHLRHQAHLDAQKKAIKASRAAKRARRRKGNDE